MRLTQNTSVADRWLDFLLRDYEFTLLHIRDNPTDYSRVRRGALECRWGRIYNHFSNGATSVKDSFIITSVSRSNRLYRSIFSLVVLPPRGLQVGKDDERSSFFQGD